MLIFCNRMEDRQIYFSDIMMLTILILCFCITLNLFDFRITLSLKEMPFLLLHF
uniref:Uncharacterized protein n=1 Tax=Arundo donax TaxID=35708 RepID=A0A0A9CXP7_ARUDO